MTIKKIILSLIALVATVSANAQVIDVYENDNLKATYYNSTSKQYKVVFKKGTTSTDAESSGTGATSEDCEKVEIYENGSTTPVTYENTSATKYKVVFRERDYVTIGGVNWATMNVGATTVAGDAATAYGDYYAWGEVEPYYDSCDGTTVTFGETDKQNTHVKGKKSGGYNWPNYCESIDKVSEWKPYGSDNILESEYDAATYEWGENWRMPTYDEFTALKNACNTTGGVRAVLASGTTIKSTGIYKITTPGSTVTFGDEGNGVTYNVTGLLFVCKDDKTGTLKRLFMPFAGRIEGEDIKTGSGYVWSSSYYKYLESQAYYFNFTITGVLPYQLYRFYGLPIRPVYVGK